MSNGASVASFVGDRGVEAVESDAGKVEFSADAEFVFRRMLWRGDRVLGVAEGDAVREVVRE